MEKQLLTLKNVYNTIFAQDYPKYSEDVLKRDAKKGITLISFWRKILAVEFKNQKYGKLIWRESETQNRHPSQICNRKCEESLAKNYYVEIRDGLTLEGMRRQIRLFENFLSDKKARPDVLFDRLGMLIDLVYNEDAAFTTDSYTFFKSYLGDSEKFSRYDQKRQYLLISYLLSFATLHSIAGECMNDVKLIEMLKQSKSKFDQLFIATAPGEDAFSSVDYISTNNTELNLMPLPKYHFFGRERELFDLCEIAASGRKVALVGIGGIGKTELMRQVIARAEEEKLVKNIALIQFERSLKNSILGAFTRFSEGKDDDKLEHIFSLLEDSKKGELLIVIDNMNELPKNSKELKRLLEMEASIIITTRLPEIPGFEKYEIESPSDDAKMLIFRDRYNKPLEPEDYDKLSKLWENRIYDHTLTRGLLGRLASHHNWSVDDILENLLPKDNDNSIELKDLYVKTYSLTKLSKEQKRFLELFAEFPYVSIKGETIIRWIDGVIPGIFVGNLQEMAASGWLMENAGMYSMHPFIAECIAKKKNPDRTRFIENSVRMFNQKFEFTCLFQNVGFASYEPTADEGLLGEIVLSLFDKVSGEISRNAFYAVYQGVVSYIYTHEDSALSQIDRAARMYKGLTSKDELKISITKFIRYKKVSSVVEELEKIKNNPEVDSIMLTEAATLLAGIAMVESNGQGIIDLYRSIEIDNAAPSALVFYAFLIVGSYSAGNLETLEEAFEKGNLLLPDAEDDSKADFLNHLMYYYFAHAQFDKALESLEKGSEIARSFELSLQNKIVLMENKATCYRVLGRFQEAEKIMKYCYEEKANLYGKNSLYIEATQGEYATALLKVGKYEEAAALYNDLIEKVESRDFASGSYFLYLNNLGNCYNAWEKPEEAIKVLNKALSLENTNGTLGLGEGNYNLAVAYYKLGNLEKCKAAAGTSLEILEPAYGPDNPKMKLMKEYLNSDSI